MKQTKVYAIVGLPGSGKTCLAHTFMFSKEIKANASLYIIDDTPTLEDLKHVAGSFDYVIITDPNFCITKRRLNAQRILSEMYSEVEWIFFENNPEQCRKNVIKRNDGRKVDDYITTLSEIYEIPADATILPVFGS